MSACFEIAKTFQFITIKLRRFRLRKCYFRVLAVKYKQSSLSENADTVLDCEFSVWKGNTKVGKQGVHSLYLFEITK